MVSSILPPRSSSAFGVRHNDAVTSPGEQSVEFVGLGWPTTYGDVSRETSTDVSREASDRTMQSVGLGWPA
jgi:hypothetical protein